VSDKRPRALRGLDPRVFGNGVGARWPVSPEQERGPSAPCHAAGYARLGRGLILAGFLLPVRPAVERARSLRLRALPKVWGALLAALTMRAVGPRAAEPTPTFVRVTGQGDLSRLARN
jgi:hypothetical protein